jgi:hypothetical protein
MKRYVLIVLAVLVLGAIACGSSGASSPTRAQATCNECTFRGTGDSIVELPAGLTGCTKAVITHRGTGHFLVRPYDASNEAMVSLVNEAGNYDGTVKWDSRAASLEIKAGGNWVIAVQK